MRSTLIAAMLPLFTVGCAWAGADEAGHVTVYTGPDEAVKVMTVHDSPSAVWLADREAIVYVSDALYSSSCPPTAEVAASNGEPVVLVVGPPESSNCTDDAVRDTFIIEGLAERPASLVVREDGQDELTFRL